MQVPIKSTPFNQKKRINALRLVGLIVALGLLFCRPVYLNEELISAILEISGSVLVLTCVFGRLWSILFIGNRKNSELVTTGPFSMTRNPLYLFSVLGVLGIGLFYGSLFVAATLGMVSYLILMVTAQKEHVHLKNIFGNKYEDYVQKTPLFFPNLRLYNEERETSFSPELYRKTFRDACGFLVLLPLVSGLKYLHESDLLPTLLWLY